MHLIRSHSKMKQPSRTLVAAPTAHKMYKCNLIEYKSIATTTVFNLGENSWLIYIKMTNINIQIQWDKLHNIKKILASSLVY